MIPCPCNTSSIRGSIWRGSKTSALFFSALPPSLFVVRLLRERVSEYVVTRRLPAVAHSQLSIATAAPTNRHLPTKNRRSHVIDHPKVGGLALDGCFTTELIHFLGVKGGSTLCSVVPQRRTCQRSTISTGNDSHYRTETDAIRRSASASQCR